MAAPGAAAGAATAGLGAGGGGVRGGLLGGGVDLGQHRADRDRFPLGPVERGDDPGGGRRDLDVDFVGGDVDQRLALVDPLTDGLAPLDDRPFGDRLAHLGQCHLN